LQRLRVLSLSLLAGLWSALLCLGPAAAQSDSRCPGTDSDIVTDRGDVTNSSVVVPAGSLQIEDGAELTAQGSARSLAAPNNRLRYGIADCAEILVDLPSYFSAVHAANWGFSDITPAVKYQLGPLPGDIDLAVTAGAALPTGAARIAGRGVQPYLQLPWSRDLDGGWGIGGQLTTFFSPSEPNSNVRFEPTFEIERDVGEQASIFVEYVGDFLTRGSPSHLFNTGASYRITPTQQIDFHIAFGLNRNAPDYIFGMGYSIRLDGLFR
jgi:hypothetical protein